MSIQTELTRLTNAKAAIKAAIEGKGVAVPDGTLLDGMAALIEAIEACGGSEYPDWISDITYGQITLSADSIEMRIPTSEKSTNIIGLLFSANYGTITTGYGRVAYIASFGINSNSFNYNAVRYGGAKSHYDMSLVSVEDGILKFISNAKWLSGVRYRYVAVWGG